MGRLTGTRRHGCLRLFLSALQWKREEDPSPLFISLMDVIATIWKDPYYPDRNQRMIEAGVDVFRLKCSHSDLEKVTNSLQAAREQINASGRPVRLLADLPEAKLRVGEFPEVIFPLERNQTFKFVTATSSPHPQTFIPIPFPHLAEKLRIGDLFYTGDGQLQFEVTAIENTDTFYARAMNAGKLYNRCSLTIERIADDLDHVSPELDLILAESPKSKPDMVAFSFVSSRKMLERLIEKLAKVTTPDWHPMVIAKIETQGGVDHFDEILELAQGIMVARGDLAMNVPFEQLGLIQKKLVAKTRQAGKYVIVSTGMLQSLLDNYLPMRSDILDVTNAALDGASAIMLCKETVISETPEHSVAVAKKIIAAVQGSRS